MSTQNLSLSLLNTKVHAARRGLQKNGERGMLALLLSCLLVGVLQGTARGKTLTEAIEAIRPSIVQISLTVDDLSEEMRQQIGRPWFVHPLGTGFLVNDDGYVMTANHVVAGGTKMLESISAGRKQLLAGLAWPNTPTGDEQHIVTQGSFNQIAFDVIATDPLHDLALLKLKQNPFQGQVSAMQIDDKAIFPLFGVARLSAQRPPDGAPVAISGYPLHQSVLVTTAGGMATSWAFDAVQIRSPGAPGWFVVPQVRHFYLADVEANPGNSGGPVYLVENGAVIGICTASLLAPVVGQRGDSGEQLRHRAGLTVVVPIQYAIELLKKNNVAFQEP